MTSPSGDMMRPIVPVSVASEPLSPFGDVAVPESPVVPLTHSPAEPAESAPHIDPVQYSYGISPLRLPGCPHPLYRFLREWTPAFVPSLEGAAALALALWLLTNDPQLGANLAGLGGTFTLFALYLVGGALFGVALYFARTDSAWLVALLLGGVALPALIIGPLFGAPYGAILLGAACILALLLLGLFRTEVGEGRVVVTRLFGRYLRVVRVAHFLRLPFERTAALLHTSERTLTTPAVHTEVESPAGILYRAQATGTVTFSLLPGEAHRVVPILATWEHLLEQQVLRALHDALTEWATHATVTGSPPPRGSLARDVMGDVRHWAQRYGIWLMRVRLHNIWLQPVGGMAVASGGPMSASFALPPGTISGTISGTTSGALPGALAGAAFGSRSRPASPAPPNATAKSTDPTDAVRTAVRDATRMSAVPATSPDEPQQSKSGEAQNGTMAPTPAPQDGSSPSSVMTISIDALVAAYEEVRQGRVTDPRTIREIAQGFQFAAENPPSDPFPYDGYAAAHVLQEYAAKLER